MSSAPSADYLCWRCGLRYEGIKEPERYKPEQWVGPPTDSRPEPEYLCGGCFGLLEDPCRIKHENPVMEDIIAAINSSGFEDTYDLVLSTRLPPALVVRGFIEKVLYEKDQVEEVPEVREVLRWVLLPELINKMRKMTPGVTQETLAASPPVADAYFRVTLEVNSPEADRLECSALASEQRIRPPSKWKDDRKFARKGGKGKGRWRRDKNRGESSSTEEPSTESSPEGSEPEDLPSANTIIKAMRGQSSERLEMLLGVDDLRKCMKAYPNTAQFRPTLEAVINRDSIYLFGRYRKFSRKISQTPWVVRDGAKPRSRCETSASEIALKPICEALGADWKRCSFCSAGREDVDVRMLGNGRPFAVEIPDAHRNLLLPHHKVDWPSLAAKTDAFEVMFIHPADKHVMEWLGWSSERHTKVYVCVVWCEDPVTEEVVERVNAMKELEIHQRTPLRVMHRRANAMRTKIMHSITCEMINPHYLKVSLACSAGMYIKEFVHGDFGRTRPSMAELLGSRHCDILQLDVGDLVEEEDMKDYIPLRLREAERKAELDKATASAATPTD
ncbi:putative tRNA pseudouridine synthase Pus10 [Perkinsus chesapeaki]|uniref:tRNA pseudouridine(55) synthase n=1 Tax=Perkinsus chesapeaki TaxID=330153 RepID=A0A7J6N1V5_PERCH|nr:putative tRNA pseudouridine synthase Pus10 [Perkinsus chesapeaki]